MIENLKALYDRFKNELQVPKELQARLSPPLLLYPTQRWNEAAQRVLIVGQETLGWDFTTGWYYDWPYPSISSFADFYRIDNSIEAMMHGYRVFEFARHQPENYRSPFWSAYRQIRRNFDKEVDGINTAVLWTNIFRMSLDCGSVVNNGTIEEITSIQQATHGILCSEIDILKPNVVLFFTGPNYNETLYSEFEGIKLENFKAHDMSRTAWIWHSSLPSISIRTYHPGYLHYGNWELIDEIEQEILEKIRDKSEKSRT